jgi:hypothetical protein
MKIRRLLFLIPIVVILLLFGIYLYTNLSGAPVSNTSSLVTTEIVSTNGTTQTVTFNSSVFQLQDFEICPSNCNYPASYISGMVFFNNTHAAVKSFGFFVNGIGATTNSSSEGVAEDAGLFYKGTTSVHIVPDHQYVVSAIVTFWDNTTYTSSETVTSDQIP